MITTVRKQKKKSIVTVKIWRIYSGNLLCTVVLKNVLLCEIILLTIFSNAVVTENHVSTSPTECQNLQYQA